MSDQSPSTSNMFAQMLGLGPMLQTVNDPNFQEQIKQIVQAIAETQMRCRRIEARLELAGFVVPNEQAGNGHDV